MATTIAFTQVVWNDLLIQSDYDSMISKTKSWETDPQYAFSIWIRYKDNTIITRQECRENCKTGFVYPFFADLGDSNDEHLRLMQDLDAALIDDSILSEFPDTLQMIIISMVDDYISCFT